LSQVETAMLVYIPSPLRSYTKNADKVTATGGTLDQVLRQLDITYPGIRFRIVTEQDHVRKHIKIFVNEELTEDLSTPVQADDRIYIVCALSGG
jgi:molybdopterin synthase sulfur carrier subunit